MMAVRWSSENVFAEYRDLQCNAMSVDCTGQYAVLAGRRCLAVIELDNPANILKKCQRQSKYEVGKAEWNPTLERGTMFALTCNQRAELLVCTNSGDLVSQHVLKAHTRVIADLNWNPFEPNLIATCSIDTFVHVWDVRDPRRPAFSMSAVGGASQVKWNKGRTNMLATSHDGDCRLWDYRKSTGPIKYIAGHLTRIHGLDWSPVQGQEHMLATSSQDGTVKIWDCENSSRPHSILTSNAPVWRGRYTPFGEGLITAVVPQLRRGENSLLLWSASNLLTPVHTFGGHLDVVLEFDWRNYCEETKDHQLVTWSKDQSLRIYTVDSHVQKLCGHDSMDDLEPMTGSGVESLDFVHSDVNQASSTTTSRESDTATTSGAGGGGQAVGHDGGGGSSNSRNTSSPSDVLQLSAETERSVESSGEMERVAEGGGARTQVEVATTDQPKTLKQEFLLLNRNIPNILVEEMDESIRTCTVLAVSGKVKVRLLLTFPPTYPVNAPPTIQFCKGTSVTNNVKNELSRILKTTCQLHVRKNLSCLEPCLRQLTATLDSYNQFENEVMDAGSPYGVDLIQQYLPQPKMYGSYHDATVPFPRTCGATFSAAGLLVCFAGPSRQSGSKEITPRALSVLSAYANNPMQPIGRAGQTTPPFSLYPSVAHSPTGEANISISSYYYTERRQRTRSKIRDSSYKMQKIGAVMIYDVCATSPICKHLAKTYVIYDRDIPSMCKKNMAAAAEVGRKDLVQVWALAAQLASADLKLQADPTMCGYPWATHPFGRKMLQSIMTHYIKQGDVQTVAMLCCTFAFRPDRASHDVTAVVRKQTPDSLTYPSQGGSPYHTIHPGETLDSHSLGALLKTNRSNSWSDCLDDYDNRHFPASPFGDPLDAERRKHDDNARLLDPKRAPEYDEFKRAYAEILYLWNLLEARAKVLKYVVSVPEKHVGVEIVNECHYCRKDARGIQCGHCKNYSFYCVICRVPVRGAFNFCMTCGHGGHSKHLMDWFKTERVCPTGCGCHCPLESLIIQEV